MDRHPKLAAQAPPLDSQRPFVLDALGQEVSTKPQPRRILSLVPSVTEALFDLGLGDRLVGCTDYCISPAGGVQSLARVGGPKTIDIEKLLSLEPDLVLANQEENDKVQVEKLIHCEIRLHVALPTSVAAAAQFLMDLGYLTGATLPAEARAQQLRQVSASPAPSPIKAACLVWQSPFIVAGGDTLTSNLMAVSGFCNVFEDHAARYPRLPLELLKRSRAQILLLPTDPYPFTEQDVAALERQFRDTAVVIVKGEWLTWYGTRMATAIEGLRHLRANLCPPT